MLRLVRTDGGAVPVWQRTVTPEQRALYEEASRIFGQGAHRPEAPGQAVKAGTQDNLTKARMGNMFARAALRYARLLAPQYRAEHLHRYGLDPNAFLQEDGEFKTE